MNVLECLTKALIGESLARNRYTVYASIAKREGYVFISRVFSETAENEKEHAETLMEFIKRLGGKADVNFEAEVKIGSTVENLKTAAEGERYEHTEMYPKFAEIAEKEGYKEIAENLRAIAKAEEFHERRFRVLLKALEEGRYFKSDNETVWICLECGYIHYGKEPPEKCPSCGHPKSYYISAELLKEVIP